MMSMPTCGEITATMLDLIGTERSMDKHKVVSLFKIDHYMRQT